MATASTKAAPRRSGRIKATSVANGSIKQTTGATAGFKTSKSSKTSIVDEKSIGKPIESAPKLTEVSSKSHSIATDENIPPRAAAKRVVINNKTSIPPSKRQKTSITSKSNPAVPESPVIKLTASDVLKTASDVSPDKLDASLDDTVRAIDIIPNEGLVKPTTTEEDKREYIPQVSLKDSGIQSDPSSLLEKAKKHLISQDPRFEAIFEKHPCNVFTPEALCETVDPFRSLVSSIISQQVSGAAAKSIKNKFVSLYFSDPEGKNPSAATIPAFPSPEQVASTSIERLRTAGLSQRKAEYIQGLAEKFRDGELSAPMLLAANDEEILEKLIAVRGLGKWSVEMFSCFELKRMDILSTGDLGVQ